MILCPSLNIANGAAQIQIKRATVKVRQGKIYVGKLPTEVRLNLGMYIVHIFSILIFYGNDEKTPISSGL